MSTSDREGDYRYISIPNDDQQQKFCSNKISTCKYSPVSFLPRFLYEQFRKCSNIFFLIIALLQQIPDVSPTGRYTTAVPLLLILSVSAVKEIFEDIKRRASDRKVNSFRAFILENKEFQSREWQEVRVGDVLRVDSDQLFPADLLLLSSSEPQGMCYIETSNLDGETNLKIKQALPATSELTTIEKLNAFEAQIECELPTRHVNEFSGNIIVKETYPFGIDQLLLRGARLKHTAWVYGAVIYTGHDAKLLMNTKRAPLKSCTVDMMTNTRIILLFFVLVLVACLSAAGTEVWTINHIPGDWYLAFLDKDARTSFLWHFLTFFILYNNLIPISLQVTLEVVRFLQASYINHDEEMYDEESESSSAARTSNLNEELGLVKFVLCDKTGTLTRNVMTFKRISVAGKIFGHNSTEEFADNRLLEEYRYAPSTKNGKDIKELLTMMAVCHTVVPEHKDGELSYQSSSPDEGALVRGAASQGFVFHSRYPDKMVLSVLGKDEELEVLDTIDFTSDRRRMSVIVRDSEGCIKLYTKGADTVILDRLAAGSDAVVDLCQEHLQNFASCGYRTLCFATRTLEKDMYTEWSKGYRDAALLITGRQQAIAKEADKIEVNLRLVGCTAIEDKLQEFVPETISTLMAADMRVWMLTGDKKETAVNIAYSCSLCTPAMVLLTVDEVIFENTFARLVKLNIQAEEFSQQGKEFALVIEGRSLTHALVGECRRHFRRLAMISRAVICCRMSPMQKAEVVELVRGVGGHIVMAVGDGANDVAMIQAANVGIGISGEEGLQAASASDYSIPRFHFLRRLLLVHGAWNHDRSVKVILYSFYKNVCLYIIELWFAFDSAWSGQTLFERWTIGLFNVFFTSLPPIVMGLFDRPVDADQMMKFPSLYKSLRKRSYTLERFLIWIATAVIHSVLLYYISYCFLDSQIFWRGGVTDGWLMFGNSTYTFVVVTVCLKAILETDSITWVMIAACVGSLFLWLIFLLIYSKVFPTISTFMGGDMAGMAWIMMSSPIFWLALVFIPCATLLFDFLFKSLSTIFTPSARQLVVMNTKCMRNELVVDWVSRHQSRAECSRSTQSSLSESAQMVVPGLQSNYQPSMTSRQQSTSMKSRE